MLVERGLEQIHDDDAKHLAVQRQRGERFKDASFVVLHDRPVWTLPTLVHISGMPEARRETGLLKQAANLPP